MMQPYLQIKTNENLTKCPKVMGRLNKSCYIHTIKYSAPTEVYSSDSNLVTCKMLY